VVSCGVRLSEVGLSEIRKPRVVHHLGNSELEKLEKEAREAQRGLWADPSPVPPWEWRKQKSNASESGKP